MLCLRADLRSEAQASALRAPAVPRPSNEPADRVSLRWGRHRTGSAALPEPGSRPFTRLVPYHHAADDLDADRQRVTGHNESRGAHTPRRCGARTRTDQMVSVAWQCVPSLTG